MLCRKHMFLLTTVVQKAVSRGLHVPGRAVELGGPTTSRAQMSKGLSLFLLVYLSARTLKEAIAWVVLTRKNFFRRRSPFGFLHQLRIVFVDLERPLVSAIY